MQNRNYCYSTLMAGALVAAVITVGASAQDECASAVAVTVGVPSAFNTITATPSGDIPTDALCAGSFLDWIATQNDVWFVFTATEPGIAEFSTCLTGSYDTSMALYKGSCTNLVACNGDGAGQAGCQPFYSRITDIGCLTGDVFYIRVGGWQGEVGTGSLTVSFAATSAGCVGATEACNVVHAGFGCDNASCCTAICTFNPLCCEVGWDQSCVDLAISQCGYYSCPPVAGAPVNNCATSATVIPGVSSVQAFNTANATMDGPNHPGGNCASGSDIFDHDIWWKVSPIANGTMTLSTCGAVSYDNKLAVYDMGTTPASFDYNQLAAAIVGCNDDGAGGACMTTETVPTTYASEMSASVALGHTYLIRMGSYATGDTGTGSLTITLPVACILDTPSGNEGEPCGSAFNDGCNAAGQSQSISLGSITAGTFWANATTRDTDFYQVSVAAGSQLTVSVKAARLATVLILSGDLSIAGCTGVSVISSGAGSCPSVATYCLNPGVYYVFVADAAFEGNPCGSGAFNDYTMQVTSAPATCPILVSGGGAVNGTCAAPGPDSMSLNTDPNLVINGLVACAVNPAFPNCSTGGTTANTYARVFPAGTVSGNISCLNFGVFSVRRAAATATTCGNFYSDIPLPATIGVYQDLDGGAPRKKTADHGVDGGDLDLIISQAVMIPGGVYRATVNFAQPVCVETYTTKNLVVIMDCPNVYAGVPGVPAASGYVIRVGGNTAGPGLNTYCRLSCADGAGEYVLTESLGGTFTAQWVCQINGNNAASCSAPPCPGDYNGDGVRNGADLATLLSAWGTPAGDITGDGTTNGADLSTLLSGWGTCPS